MIYTRYAFEACVFFKDGTTALRKILCKKQVRSVQCPQHLHLICLGHPTCVSYAPFVQAIFDNEEGKEGSVSRPSSGSPGRPEKHEGIFQHKLAETSSIAPHARNSFPARFFQSGETANGEGEEENETEDGGENANAARQSLHNSDIGQQWTRQADRLLVDLVGECEFDFEAVASRLLSDETVAVTRGLEPVTVRFRATAEECRLRFARLDREDCDVARGTENFCGDEKLDDNQNNNNYDQYRKLGGWGQAHAAKAWREGVGPVRDDASNVQGI